MTAAANRTDGSIHPLPNRIRGGAARKVCDTMKVKGLIDENLTITQVGRNALFATCSAEARRAIMEDAENAAYGSNIDGRIQPWPRSPPP